MKPTDEDDVVRMITDELLAHGEFSSIPANNRANAELAAKAALDIALSAAGVKPREWQSMDNAPTDGTPFVALEIRGGEIHVRVYKYEGHPNYWHCKREGVCIRPQYQGRFVWINLPDSILSALTTEGE